MTACVIAAPLLLAWVLKAELFQTCHIAGNSMLPTLSNGDSVGLRPAAYQTLVQALSFGPSNTVPGRGDIVVFSNPEDSGSDEYLVKRVIGLPDDTISMKGGAPVINGWAVPYCDAGIYADVTNRFEAVQGHLVVEFLANRAYLTLYTFARKVPRYDLTYQVKEHEVFVLGDNRFESSDSRSWSNGRGAGVPISTIRGRADWFLVGATREGSLDFSRLFEHFDLRAHLEGLDTSGLTRRINACLRNRPVQTTPPRHSAARLVAQFTPK
jgi:signal peptidase I